MFKIKLTKNVKSIEMGQMLLMPFIAPQDRQVTSIEFSSYEEAAKYIHKLQMTKTGEPQEEYFIIHHP